MSPILGAMKMMDARQFEAVRGSMLHRLGRISSSTAQGLIIDLQMAVERAGLIAAKVKWRGGDDGMFTATGQFDGEPSQWATGALAALDRDLLYDDGAATIDLSSAGVHISLATWAPDLGLATVQIDAKRVTANDLPGH
jgi:hypothetical protein